ncbi:hypothetical protein HELRODRAFT_175928 [Helobdella robusta]|uniref:Uncharacterized protein n=1 Tax=Helobdella robusta TaxID=6412 RepID=T1F9W9_HELRO|nr:hypothetical protein HELRODRAFT_175928 [Helobdella robusta]ESO00491.1 hypothetical protein HELRODRAFT_175928 [Helobdella robusta]
MRRGRYVACSLDVTFFKCSEVRPSLPSEVSLEKNFKHVRTCCGDTTTFEGYLGEFGSLSRRALRCFSFKALIVLSKKGATESVKARSCMALDVNHFFDRVIAKIVKFFDFIQNLTKFGLWLLWDIVHQAEISRFIYKGVRQIDPRNSEKAFTELFPNDFLHEREEGFVNEPAHSELFTLPPCLNKVPLGR